MGAVVGANKDMRAYYRLTGKAPEKMHTQVEVLLEILQKTPDQTPEDLILQIEASPELKARLKSTQPVRTCVSFRLKDLVRQGVLRGELKPGDDSSVEMPPRKKKEPVAVEPAPVSAPIAPVAPVAPKKRAPKKAQVAPESTGPIKAVVVAAPSIQPDQIKEIRVRRKEIHGTEYYIDPSKGKLYTKNFSYVGRWDEQKDVIDRDVPDSDVD